MRAVPDNAGNPFTLADPADGAATDRFGWPLDADGLRETLTTLSERHPELRRSG